MDAGAINQWISLGVSAVMVGVHWGVNSTRVRGLQHQVSELKAANAEMEKDQKQTLQLVNDIKVSVATIGTRQEGMNSSMDDLKQILLATLQQRGER